MESKHLFKLKDGFTATFATVDVAESDKRAPRQYWIKQGGEKVEMPRKFVMEMIADWKAASYQYTGSDDIQDWLNTKLKIDRFHPATLDLLRKELLDIGYSL